MGTGAVLAHMARPMVGGTGLLEPLLHHTAGPARRESWGCGGWKVEMSLHLCCPLGCWPAPPGQLT